jgi:hypothetical protein
MGKWVGSGKNRRYMVKKGKMWRFAKAPGRSTTKTSRKRARTATRKVATVARRRYSRKKKGSGRAKRPSLVATLALLGVGSAVSGSVAAAAAQAMGAASPLLAKIGITTGAGLLGAAIAARLACSYSPAFRKAYVPLVGAFGFRP